MYKPKPGEDAATSSFLSAVSTAREIRKPIEVQLEPERVLPRTADEYEITYNPETDKDHPYERWRRNRVLKFLISREIARYLDRRTFITVSVREAIIYILFLIVLTIITFEATPLDMFYFSQAMATLYTKQLFSSHSGQSIIFYEANTVGDIWDYMLSINEKLFHDFWYSKREAWENLENTEEYFYENKLIGMPQIRQVRVKNGTCVVQSDVSNMTSDCYGRYSTDNEFKLPFGNEAGSIWQFKNGSETKSRRISGSLATYNEGGYIAILQNPAEVSLQTILKLKQQKWIDRSTRAVFLEFTIYNGNVNLFCIFKLIFEIPPTGGVIPSHWNYVQKLLRYDPEDYFEISFEIVFILFFMFFTIQKILEFITLRGKLCGSFWSWIDIIILVMCYLTVAFDILLYVTVQKQLPELVKKENEMKYASFDEMSQVYIMFSYSFATLIAFAFFRLLKYLNIVHAMYQLQSTISRAKKDIFSYCVMFFYVYFVFALIGLFLFGSKLEDYKTFPMAVFALMRSSVGDFNYNKLVQTDPVVGPIFFFCFVFFIAFIFVNIFLAILVSKYEEVRSEVRIGGAKTFIGEMIKHWLIRMLEKADCTWLLSQIERRRFEKKIRSPTEAIRQYLRQAGYSELEIELFFKKYDITDSKITAMDEDRISYRQGEREAPPPLSQKDILRYIVIQKLEYLENHYNAANELIDLFLAKLTKFEEKRK